MAGWDDAEWRGPGRIGGRVCYWLSGGGLGASRLTLLAVGDAYWIATDEQTDLADPVFDPTINPYELGPLESLDLAKKAYRVLLATHRY